mmetsp:Transcript_137050/g.242239  ORF Transcript_137050/g.242239 Transcript_137050/m.242239 type:complete len:596 (-) Transcript_137050:47-1834(-)
MTAAFPDYIKGWELPVCQSPRDSKEDFEDLLNKLRRLHSKVCARNSFLESELVRISADPYGQEDFDVMPVPKECALDLNLRTSPKGAADDPRAVPRTPPQTARVEVAGNAEVRTMIDQLTQQQQNLNDRLLKVLEAPATRRSSVMPGTLGKPPSERRPSFSSDAESSNQKSKWRSNFAVSKGSTKDLTKSNSLEGQHKRKDFTSCKGVCVFLVNSTYFIGTCSVILMSYAVFIAVETELLALDPERDTSASTVIHIIYSVFFTLELFVRLGAEGSSFFLGQSALWNCMDTALVVSIVIDLVLAIWASNLSTVATAGPIMRTLRIVRVVRTMRLVRTVRHLHEFQKMAFALASSLKTLLCSTGVVFFVMFFFAVIFTQGAADNSMRATIQDLSLRYGDLPSTLYTLFLCLSNGISWDYAYEPLSLMGLGYGYCFLAYIVISLFGVLNVVTSIFVESVIRSAQHHKDVIVQDKEKEKYIAVRHMQEVFRQVDFDGSGHVTSEELEHFLGAPDLRRYMEALDVSAEDTRLLFRLLDRDGSHVIDIDEFCEGCLRLKGNARSIDMQTLIFQMKNFLSKWAEFTEFVAEGFDQLNTVRRK